MQFLLLKGMEEKKQQQVNMSVLSLKVNEVMVQDAARGMVLGYTWKRC